MGVGNNASIKYGILSASAAQCGIQLVDDTMTDDNINKFHEFLTNRSDIFEEMDYMKNELFIICNTPSIFNDQVKLYPALYDTFHYKCSLDKYTSSLLASRILSLYIPIKAERGILITREDVEQQMGHNIKEVDKRYGFDPDNTCDEDPNFDHFRNIARFSKIEHREGQTTNTTIETVINDLLCELIHGGNPGDGHEPEMSNDEYLGSPASPAFSASLLSPASASSISPDTSHKVDPAWTPTYGTPPETPQSKPMSAQKEISNVSPNILDGVKKTWDPSHRGMGGMVVSSSSFNEPATIFNDGKMGPNTYNSPSQGPTSRVISRQSSDNSVSSSGSKRPLTISDYNEEAENDEDEDTVYDVVNDENMRDSKEGGTRRKRRPHKPRHTRRARKSKSKSKRTRRARKSKRKPKRTRRVRKSSKSSRKKKTRRRSKK